MHGLVFWTILFALKMSVIRLYQFSVYFTENLSSTETHQLFWNGFRFDLMIVGFWLSPVIVLLLLAKAIRVNSPVLSKFNKFYLVGSWLFVCYVYLRDLISFPFVSDRLYGSDILNGFLLEFAHLSQLTKPEWLATFVLIVLLFKFGMPQFLSMIEEMQNSSLTKLLIMFFWIALICRSSLGPHHLRPKDCEITQIAKVRALCINPIFAMSR